MTTVTDLVIHPDRSATAFVSNTAAIFRTTDGGATWTNITGNLLTFVPGTLRSLTYVIGKKGEGLVVGTQDGVFFATADGGFTTWARLGSSLPTVPIFDLDFDRAGRRPYSRDDGAWGVEAARRVSRRGGRGS